LEVNGDNVVTSSQQITVTDTVGFSTFSSSVDTRLDDLESFSSSLEGGYVNQTELANATGALENSIATKLDTGSYNTDSSSFDLRIDNLEIFSSSLEGDFVTQTELADATGSLINSIGTKLDTGSYNTASSSFDSRLDQLETVSGSQDGRLDNLESFTSSQETKNSTLETYTSSVDTKFTSVGYSTSSLNTFTSSQELKNTTLETVTSSLDSRLDNVEITTASFEGRLTNIESTTQSLDGRVDNIEIFTSSQETKNSTLETYTASVDTKFSAVQSATESLDQRLDSFEAVSASYARTDVNNTFGGIQSFNDISVDGTASFAYIQSTTGSAKIIGDAFIVLNNNTPSERYAGLLVIDSGSNPSTASFFFDGQTNDWNYEYSGSAGIDYAVNIFGPEYSTKGSPTYLTDNRIPKAVDNHHLNDSNITDTGTLITLGSNSVVEGTFYATGTTLVSGSSQISYTGLSSIPTNIVSSSSDTSTIDITISNGVISAVAIGGIVSGSSQVNADTITNFDTNVKAKLDADGVHSGSNQVVQFSKVGIGTASDATYELKVSGDIGATGDVVAYISSDRRLKDNITPISSPLEKINKLSGNSFEWNEEKQHIYKGKDYGVVAQEVQEIFPELVQERETGYLAVKYEKLVAVLIEGIKELDKEVKELKSKLEEQNGSNS